MIDRDHDDDAPIDAGDVVRARATLLRVRVAVGLAVALIGAALASVALADVGRARDARARAARHRDEQQRACARLSHPLVHDGVGAVTVVEGGGAVYLVDHGVVVAGGARR